MQKINEDLKLIDAYITLLSEKKQKYIELYYYEDLSLNEIASMYNISRAAVYDAISEGIRELKVFEEKLNYVKKQEKRVKFIKNLISDEETLKKYLELEYGEN